MRFENPFKRVEQLKRVKNVPKVSEFRRADLISFRTDRRRFQMRDRFGSYEWVLVCLHNFSYETMSLSECGGSDADRLVN